MLSSSSPTVGPSGIAFNTIEMGFWLAPHLSTWQWRNSILGPYSHAILFTRTIRDGQDSWKNGVWCTTECNANITGHSWQMIFTRLWKISENAPEISCRKGNGATYNLFTAGDLLESVAMDILGHFPKVLSCNSIVLVMWDHYMKLKMPYRLLRRPLCILCHGFSTTG